MTTLIVGCGYLGRRVGRLRRSIGDRVLGTVRTAESAEVIRRWGIEPVLYDVTRPGSTGPLPAADRVVYAVGFDRSAGDSMRAVYVDGLRETLDRLASGVNRVVYASSTGVYGRNDGGWVDEETPAEPKSDSGVVCLDAEGVLREWRAGGASVVVRFAGLYGPGRIVRRAAVVAGEPIVGDPGRFLNLIHIDDAASAVSAALDAESPGPLYVACDERPVTRREYYSSIAAALGAPEPTYRSPAAGSPEARREEANKRVDARRIRRELALAWAFPSIDSGVPDALARPDEPGA